MTSGLIVTTTHMHEIGYCARGGRRWAERYGLDWSEFVKNGLPVEAFEATGDAMGLRIAQYVREQHGQEK